MGSPIGYPIGYLIGYLIGSAAPRIRAASCFALLICSLAPGPERHLWLRMGCHRDLERKSVARLASLGLHGWQAAARQHPAAGSPRNIAGHSHTAR
jgi:hypothetical protein